MCEWMPMQRTATESAPYVNSSLRHLWVCWDFAVLSLFRWPVHVAVRNWPETWLMAQQQVSILAPTLEASPGVPLIDAVVPVYNEVGLLGSSVVRLHRYLVEWFPFSFRV